MPELTNAGKEELALALLLWKDFKSDGKFLPEVTIQEYEFAERLRDACYRSPGQPNVYPT